MMWPFKRRKKKDEKEEIMPLSNGKEELQAAFAAAKTATAEFRRGTAAFQLSAEQVKRLAEMRTAKRA